MLLVKNIHVYYFLQPSGTLQLHCFNQLKVFDILQIVFARSMLLMKAAPLECKDLPSPLPCRRSSPGLCPRPACLSHLLSRQRFIQVSGIHHIPTATCAAFNCWHGHKGCFPKYSLVLNNKRNTVAASMFSSLVILIAAV